MPAFIAWVDYSSTERQRMRQAVALFEEKDTRDELGIGSIRDAFADELFPGTSVIQTRLLARSSCEKSARSMDPTSRLSNAVRDTNTGDVELERTRHSENGLRGRQSDAIRILPHIGQ